MDSFFKGIYLFNPETDFDVCCKTCRDLNIDTVVTNPFIYEKPEFQAAIKKHEIKVNYNFPVFCNTEYLQLHPDSYCVTSRGRRAIGNEWLHFACPSDEEHFASQKNHLQKIMETFNPHRVSFDFIRFYLFWEMTAPDTAPLDIEDGCYCRRCLERFQQECGLELKEGSKKWIFDNVYEQWGSWKTDLIAKRISELSHVVRSHNRETQIGIKTVPWLDDDFKEGMIYTVGQDLNKIAPYVDFFAPMSYTHMTGHTTDKIHALVEQVHRKTNKPVLAAVQIEKVYRDEPISIEEFNRQIEAAMREPSTGMFIFVYDQLAGDDAKARILKDV